MDKFARDLVTEWRRLALPARGAAFVVAVSGGADSLALALALADLRARRKLDLRFVVAHFDHGLRGAESAADAAFVEDFAARHDFEFALGRGRVAAAGNLEQNARRARYEFLAQTARARGADGILTAHTADDQAETLLLNLIRGSGLDGLAGIRPLTRDFAPAAAGAADGAGGGAGPVSHCAAPRPAGLLLVRPLVARATRRATEDYCRRRGEDFRLDSMNERLDFRRVRVRRTLLPLLGEMNPRIVETLARTAALLRAEADRAAAAAPPFADGETLAVKDLAELAPAALRRVLRAWLAARRGDLRRLGQAHIAALEALVAGRKSGRTVELPGGETVEKSGGRLRWRKKML